MTCWLLALTFLSIVAGYGVIVADAREITSTTTTDSDNRSNSELLSGGGDVMNGGDVVVAQPPSAEFENEGPELTTPPPLPYLPLCIDEHSPSLAKFIQPLSFPSVIDISLLSGCLTLSAFRTTQKFHRDLPPTTVYAFGTSLSTASVPGPTLLARRNVESCVRWENHIADDWHFLPLAHHSAVEWANPTRGGVPVVAHLHGGEVAPPHDGNPDAWFTSRNETGPAYVTNTYVYPNRQNAMALWYHDHTFGITRLNNLAGLNGMYLIRPTEEEEQALGHLPDGIILVLRDLRFFANGSINLPGPADFETQYWCPEWYDTWAVNGLLWPYAKVSRAAYRFRLLLATNGRYVGLYHRGPDGRNLTMLQIGTDGGFLDEPMLIDNMLLFSSDRVDYIVDFSELEPDDEVVLMNFPLPLDDADEPYLEPSSSVIMKFVVVEEGGLEEGLIRHPDYLRRLRSYLASSTAHQKVYDDLIATQPRVTREISINLMTNHTTGRGYAFSFHNLTWREPVRIEPIDGSAEIWELINVSDNPHSVHIHLLHFLVINQQRIDMDAYNNGTCSMKVPYPDNGTCFVDYPINPFPYQRGWKDNVITWDGYVLRLLLRFTTREGKHFSFNPTVEPGYVIHCHILQHEDHIMMRPFKLQPSIHNIN